MKQLLSVLVIFAMAATSFAQTKTIKPAVVKPATAIEPKYDMVLLMDGDEIIGTVKAINNEEILFTHKEELLEYSIKKIDIQKINFASGRIQIFNKAPLPSEKKAKVNSYGDNGYAQNENNTISDHHNKVAILPFHFIIDKRRAAKEMSEEVQQECYSYLMKHSEGLTFLDPRTTDAILVKAAITFDNIEGYTMDELCNILGVEYVVDGKVTQNRTGTNTAQSNSYNDRYNNKNNSFKTTVYSNSNSTQRFQTSMNLSIYTDRNTNIYSAEKTSIWTSDTYKSTLDYLLKRTPLYKK